jgi:ubiquinone/menaquinone biosynthesis C-methylase UbiE
MNDLRALIPVWHADTMEKAKKLIYDPPAWKGKDGESWEQRTFDAIPVILNATVLSALPGRGRVLEIGCGVGRLLAPMAKQGFYEAIGIDISPSMVKFSETYLKGVENARVFLCDGQTIEFEDKHFDFVYSMIAFQHIPYRAAIQNYLRETYRVLKPGGVVRIQTYVGQGLDVFGGTEGYYYPSTAEFAKDFRAAGLEVLEEQTGVWHELHLWVTARKSA